MLAFKFLAFAVILPATLGYPRLDKDKAALLIVDHQIGLFQLVGDINPIEFRNNIIGHAELGVLFSLPTVLTTSTETGEREALATAESNMLIYPRT